MLRALATPGMACAATLTVAAAVAMAIWHGPGFLLSLRAVPPPQAATEQPAAEDVTIGLPARSGKQPSTATARVFASQAVRDMQGSIRHPAVIYMPGWGGRATDNDVLLRRIAGDGYLVIALDDVAFDPPDPAESQDVRAARTAELDLSSPDGIGRFVHLADLKANLAAEKVSRVIDAISSEHPARLGSAGLLADPKRIAVLGFSMGGATAAAVLHNDDRVRAAVNLDGWILGHAAGSRVNKPYLVIDNSNSAAWLALGATRRNVLAMDTLSGERSKAQLSVETTRSYVLQGTVHSDFSDGLHQEGRWRHWRPWRRPLGDPRSIRDQIDRRVLDFLGDSLRARSSTH